MHFLFCKMFYYFVYTFTLTGASSIISVNETGRIGDSSCAMIQLHDNPYLEIKLFQNKIISKIDYYSVMNDKLKDALFSVGHNFTKSEGCILEICGFLAWDIAFRHFRGDCHWYNKTANGKPIHAPSIYSDWFVVSSISCACKTVISPTCKFDTCVKRNLTHKWQGSECGILYQEHNCRDCYFEPIILLNDTTFQSLNSYQFKSIIIRPGCRVEKMTLGEFFWTHHKPTVLVFTGLVLHTEPVYNQNSENYTCYCPGIGPPGPDIMLDTWKIVMLVLFHAGLVVIIGIIVIIKRFKLCQRQPVTLLSTDISEDDEEDNVSYVSVATNSSILSLANTNLFDNPEENEFQQGLESEGHHGVMKNAVSLPVGTGTVDESASNNFINWSNENEILEENESFCERVGQVCSLPQQGTSCTTVPFDAVFDTSEDHFQVDKPLDKGNFGQVSRGTLQVAIKRVKVSSGSEEKEISRKSLQQEIKILSELGYHQNVVRLLGVHVGDYQKGELSLIVELCPKGSLKSYLETTVKTRITEKERELAMRRLANIMGDNGYPNSSNVSRIEEAIVENDLQNVDPEMLVQFYRWIYQIVCGMQFIQSRNIVHVDLATRNVFLNHKLIAKVGDFGLSKKIYIKDYVSSRKDSLPIRWVAPESLKNYKCTKMSDVWSFGIIVWEIFSLGKIPYEGINQFQIMTYLCDEKKRLDCPQYAPENVYSKLIECWSEDPDERPTFDALEVYFSSKLKQIQIPSGEQKKSDVDAKLIDV